MDIIIDTIKQDIGTVITVGQQLAGFFFLLACLFNYIVTLQGKSSWTRLITSLVIVFVMLHHYVWIMDSTKLIVDGVRSEVTSNQNFVTQYQDMVERFQEVYEDNEGTHFVAGISIERISQKMLHNLIVNLSFIFYGLISFIMNALRADLIGILWMLGPLLIPFLLFQSTMKIVGGWYTGLISIYLWPLVWQITLGIAVAQSGNIQVNGQGLIEFISLNFATCAMLIMAPLLISSLAAGAGAGFVGSIASAVTYGKVAKVGGGMVSAVRGG